MTDHPVPPVDPEEAAARLRLWIAGEGIDRTVDDDILAILTEREDMKARIARLERLAGAVAEHVCVATEMHERAFSDSDEYDDETSSTAYEETWDAMEAAWCDLSDEVLTAAVRALRGNTE